jgi:hypothetical protein
VTRRALWTSATIRLRTRVGGGKEAGDGLDGYGLIDPAVVGEVDFAHTAAAEKFPDTKAVGEQLTGAEDGEDFEADAGGGEVVFGCLKVVRPEIAQGASQGRVGLGFQEGGIFAGEEAVEKVGEAIPVILIHVGFVQAGGS